MKTMLLEKTSLEWGGGRPWVFEKLLVTLALFWALSWSPIEAWAKTVSSEDDGVKVTEVTQPWTEVMQWKATISLQDVIQMMEEDWIDVSGEEEDWPGIEPDPEWDDEWEPEWWKESGGSRIWVHGFVQVWTSVVPDFAGIFSDKASALMCISAWDQKTWLWVSLIRLDDFSSDPAYPVSRATVIVPSWSKSIGEGWSLETGLECTFMDKLPGEREFLPYVVWSYKTKGEWTIEWKYFHQFREWQDMDAFRLWITKKITDALSLTGHWWYKSDYAKHFYGRVIVDVSLWWWFGAQMSCIYKDWVFTPTRWVMYRF